MEAQMNRDDALHHPLSVPVFLLWLQKEAFDLGFHGTYILGHSNWARRTSPVNPRACRDFTRDWKMHLDISGNELDFELSHTCPSKI